MSHRDAWIAEYERLAGELEEAGATDAEAADYLDSDRGRRQIGDRVADALADRIDAARDREKQRRFRL